MRPILKGSTDQSVVIRIVDSADGTPETGVVFNTSGIDLWYRREGATKTSITEATLSALTDAHSDGGFLHIGDGYYRLDLPDAAVATGANGVAVGGAVTGKVVIGCYLPLVDFNPYDAVRLGLTALPNAAAEAAGGLFTRGTGAGQIRQDANGRIDSNVKAYGDSAGTFASGRPEVNTSHWGGTAVATAVILAAANIASDAITAAKIAADALTSSKFADGALTSAKFASGAFDAVWSVAARTLTAFGFSVTVGTNNDKTGYGLTSAYDQAQTAAQAGDAMTLEDDAITAAKIAPDAIGASELAAGAASEIASAVRTELATELGRVDVAVSTRLATSGYTAPLDAAGVRSAVGLASANLDTQLDALPTSAELTTALGAADDAVLAAIAALNNLSAAGVRAAVGLASANLDTQLAAIDTKTTNLPSDPADQSLIIAATNALAAAIAALNNLSAAQVLTQVNTALTAEVSDSVPAVGSRPSIAQAAYMWAQFLSDRAVAGTTMTIKKPNGDTLFTVTLDDADAPTSLVRAS